MVLPLVTFVYLTKARNSETETCRASGARLTTELMALRSEVERQKAAFDSEAVILTARVENVQGDPATHLEGLLVREDATGDQPACPRRKLVNGEFTCRTPLHDLHTRFLFNALKAGSDDPVRQAAIVPMEPIVTISTDEPQ